MINQSITGSLSVFYYNVDRKKILPQESFRLKQHSGEVREGKKIQTRVVETRV